MQAPPRRRGLGELLSLRNVLLSSTAFGKAPTDLLSRRFKNHLRWLGVWRPKRELSFRWTYTPQIVMRYDYSMPNRHYRYLFFKKGGTIREFKKIFAWHGYVLKGAPPKVTFQNGDEYFVDRQSGRFIRKNRPNYRSRNRGPTDLGQHPVKRVPKDWDQLKTPQGPVYVPPKKRDYYTRVDYGRTHTLSKLAAVGRLFQDGETECINVLGGRILPLKHHKKYWYFLRKKGHFTFSLHHPYGDEARCFPHPNQRNAESRFF